MATKNLGRIVGLSAYEVWLNQGNTGTEEDFFNSLKGINGNDYVLTEADKEDISKLVEVNIPTKVSQLENDKNYLSSIPLEYVTENELTEKNYATESFVANKIAEAELSGGEVDLSGFATKDELNSKVDKVKGKSLVDDTEIERLASVTNYDDTELKRQINSKADTSNIPTKVSELTNDSGFINSIPSEYVTETELNNKGYLTQHQDISNLATKSELNNKVDKVKGKSLINDTEIERLANVTNYNDTELRNIVNSKATISDMTNYIEEHKDELKGADGKDGVSVTHSWNGTTLNITSASGTSSMDLKGEKGDTYTLTETDKQEIVNMVDDKGYLTSVPSDYKTKTENDSLYQAKGNYLTSVPSEYITETELNAKGYLTEIELTEEQLNEISDKVAEAQKIDIVDSVDEMTDTSKSYVLKSTGTIWTYKEDSSEQEVTVTDVIESTADNPAHDNSYVSKGNVSARDGCFVTPYINIGKYSGQIVLKVEGVTCLSEEGSSASAMDMCDENRNYISRKYMSLAQQNYNYVVTALCDSLDKVTTSADGKTTTFIIDLPRSPAPENKLIHHIRFTCGLIGSGSTWAASKISIEHKEIQTVTETAWVDTGVGYGGNGVDEETLAKISELNNEGEDPITIKLLSQPVLDFYNSADYPSDDYTTSHLSRITYPYRADIPTPFTVKWEYNENAMRTEVAVDIKAIGTLNRFTMLTYNATGLNKLPLYNLLPNKTYYYRVTHIFADGSIEVAKSGSFTTSNEPIRFIYVDGTQNVRDLGGKTGVDGKTVKYGALIRGAALNDSVFIATAKGRRALVDIGVLAELNLGSAETSTMINANTTFKKIGYKGYAAAITGEEYRAQFKEVLEWIVECLNSSKPIYMHCQGGCDRTGTLVFQLLGLLGVSESDLAKEYELSSFSDVGFGRLRTTTLAVNTYDYVGMVEALKTYSGDTITDKFYDFAVNGCGVSEETITSFRNLMLE